MSEEKNIKNYSAADIEKYWTGKLSGKEMHALEKAAMDDPFLADALEGYKYSSSTDRELHSLQGDLDSRVAGSTPIINLKKKGYPWLRVAAAIIIIIGVGLFAQQLLFKKDSELAFIDAEKNDDNKTSPEAPSNANNEQVKKDSIPVAQNNTGRLPDTLALKVEKTKVDNLTTNNLVTTDTLKTTNNQDVAIVKTDDAKKEGDKTLAPPVAAAKIAERKDAENEKALSQDRDKGRVADNTELVNKKGNISPRAKNQESAGVLNDKYPNFAALNNRYNYRVVDVQNNPVPFANVMNTRDNVGTYTDIRGNFNLVSSDSVLDVQVKSLGYNSSNFRLIPSTKQTGEIILKEDDNARREILANNRKVVSNVTRKDSAQYEEPEVGWGYYNTYVANNFQVPENVLTKNRGSEVELSFDIDKNGQPVNIRITRSSQCKECDDEAVRLLKEGPKWKRKGRKSKGSVTISVDK